MVRVTFRETEARTTTAGRDFERVLDAADGAAVWVGLRASTPEADSELITYASANEFGTRDGHVPERSFMRSTVDEQRTSYSGVLASVLRVADSVSALERGLGRLGLRGVRDVQRKITSNVPPPNAPSTVRRKGSTGTLRDTGRLRQSIDFEVTLGR